MSSILLLLLFFWQGQEIFQLKSVRVSRGHFSLEYHRCYYYFSTTLLKVAPLHLMISIQSSSHFPDWVSKVVSGNPLDDGWSDTSSSCKAMVLIDWLTGLFNWNPSLIHASSGFFRAWACRKRISEMIAQMKRLKLSTEELIVIHTITRIVVGGQRQSEWCNRRLN